MIHFIKKLPIDIIQKIISYTYNIQNKILLEDIKNYNKTKTLLLNYYYDYWIKYALDVDPEDKYWLVNNLFEYLNNNLSLEFTDIVKRNIFLTNIKKIIQFVQYFEKKNLSTKINILLGLLIPNERNDFIFSYVYSP